ncbi:ParM/StbA family protein [Limosilactobacillus reuteri]|uniref:ParM/StbA family protein n=1 Tax=Limosilactobacillus reuteri TaxID=1598 RepID=UPI001E38E84C|nr:ParM/StbA family protein [Limosilactobacillus reuteri]MCC4466863.1 ParM/StbA family protein [Limosilactobacillus reuteri]MCC4472891.1 ParM/StbA family protein [Limosilactobacillus reuteri]
MSQSNTKEYIMSVANDLGYGSVKANIDGEDIKFPSVVSAERPQDIAAPIEFDTDADRDEYMKNFLNTMDVSVSSNAVKVAGRFLVGNAAVNSGLNLRQFDVNDYTGKSETDLAVILTLSLIAGKRVKEAYAKGEDLKETLKAKVNMATALPISEGKKNNAKDNYRQRYMDSTHTVTFHNFKDPITVSIEFNNVYVALEGETAQMLISSDYDGLSDKIKADFDKNYPDMKDEVAVNDLIESRNVLGIDIGEGTTDIVAIINGKANPAASTSLPQGYGNVLQEAVRVLQDQQMNFEERSQLQSFLNEKVSPLRRARQDKVRNVVYEQLEPLADNIINAVSQTMRTAKDTELVFVYGGGSIPMEDESNLREKLSTKLKSFSGGYDVPVVWIDKEYAQLLNELGLQLIANALK